MTNSNLHDDIGLRIRKRRLKLRKTLKNIAEDCSISLSLVSKIETGKVIPSVGTLIKISRALGTTLALLLEDNNNVKVVFTQKNEALQNLITTKNGFHTYPYATEHKSKKISPFLFILKKKDIKQYMDTHDGDEFMLLTKGIMEVKIGKIEYTLHEGDSLYFDGMDPHRCTPVTDEVEFVSIHV